MLDLPSLASAPPCVNLPFLLYRTLSPSLLVWAVGWISQPYPVPFSVTYCICPSTPRRALSSAVGPAVQSSCSIAFPLISCFVTFARSIYDHLVCRFVDFCILQISTTLVHDSVTNTIDGLNDIDDHFAFHFALSVGSRVS